MEEQIIRLLLVEDDVADAKLIRLALQRTGNIRFIVDHAESLRDAQDILSQESFDVALVDLSLSDSWGGETLKVLRQISPALPIVVLTGLDDDQLSIEALQNGAQEFLVKGEVSPSLLPKVVRFAMIQRQTQLELEKANEALKERVVQSSRELRWSEERFRLLVEGVVDYAIIFLDPEGRVASWNPGAERIFGYNAGEIMESSLQRFFRPGDVEQHKHERLLQTALEAGRASEEHYLTRADGTAFFAFTVLSALQDESAPLQGFACIVRDVTELREAHQRALQSERLAAVGQTMTGIAHESRNALQRIQASVNRLRRRSRGNDDLLQIINEIDVAGEDLKRLYDAVRDYAKPLSLDPKQVRIRDLWRAAWEKLKRYREDRDIELIEVDEKISAELDPYLMEQVFRNLFENTLEACRDPVRVCISTRRVKRDDFSYIELLFSDDGPGIPEEYMGKVFSPFFTTRSEGTGLGLPLVRRIVERHGGTVRIVRIGEPGFLRNGGPDRVLSGFALQMLIPVELETEQTDMERRSSASGLPLIL